MAPIATSGSSADQTDQKKVDENILLGSERKQHPSSDIPPPPTTVTPSNPSDVPLIPPQDVAKIPPSPEDVGSTAAKNPTAPPTPSPPLGTGTATVATPPPPPPRRKRRRWGRWLMNLIILTTLGYGLGTYYALVSDNWHDFFTEYIPFGEDIVAYFEEREFRRRFQDRTNDTRLYPQVRGEQKVTIPSKAGVEPRTTSEANGDRTSDLGTRGRHVSAVEDNILRETTASTTPTPGPTSKGEKPTEPATPKAPAQATKEETKSQPKSSSATTPDRPSGGPEAAQIENAKPVEPINHLTVESATEPVVQDIVKIVNDIVTVINADNASPKYGSVINKVKEDVAKVISGISTLRETEKKAAEDRINAIHAEFDDAARELLKRTQEDVQNQEMRWKEEYEAERQRLWEAYENKLKAELENAQKVYDAKLKNHLLEQSIELQRKFASTIRERVESERGGRLSKLDELSSSVAELEKLTAEWNSVLESNLKTQHLLVAVEAVRSLLENADKPTPFIEQLAALKEVASGDAVIDAAIASINPRAYQKGIPTPSMLIDRFRRVAAEVRKASLLPENAGVASHAASLLLSKVMFKKEGVPAGNDVESVLSRAEMLLEEGRLEDAAREVNGLQGWAKVLASDWLKSVREVVEVQSALDVIATEARLQSLLVD